MSGHTLAAFATALKTRLRALDASELADDCGSMGSTMTGWMPDVVIDHVRLDAEIDALCAEFVARQKTVRPK